MCKPPYSKHKTDPIKRLEDKSQEIFDKMQIHHNMMMSLVDDMKDGWNGEGDADVKKKDMTEFPIMDWEEVRDGVWIQRRLDVFGLVCFDTIIFEGVFFGNHFHSDADEICDVILGELHDKITNKTFGKGKHSMSLKNVFHHVGCVKGEKIPNLKSRGLPFDECIGTELRVYFK